MIDGHKVMALIDTGDQVLMRCESYCKAWGYEIHPVGHMLYLESTGGFKIPYLGLTEVTVQIP